MLHRLPTITMYDLHDYDMYLKQAITDRIKKMFPVYLPIMNLKNIVSNDSPLKSPTIPYIIGILWGIFPCLT